MATTHQQLLDGCAKEKDSQKAKRLWTIYNLVVNNKSIGEVAEIFHLCFNMVKNYYEPDSRWKYDSGNRRHGGVGRGAPPGGLVALSIWSIFLT